MLCRVGWTARSFHGNRGDFEQMASSSSCTNWLRSVLVGTIRFRCFHFPLGLSRLGVFSRGFTARCDPRRLRLNQRIASDSRTSASWQGYWSPICGWTTSRGIRSSGYTRSICCGSGDISTSIKKGVWPRRSHWILLVREDCACSRDALLADLSRGHGPELYLRPILKFGCKFCTFHCNPCRNRQLNSSSLTPTRAIAHAVTCQSCSIASSETAADINRTKLLSEQYVLDRSILGNDSRSLVDQASGNCVSRQALARRAEAVPTRSGTSPAPKTHKSFQERRTVRLPLSQRLQRQRQAPLRSASARMQNFKLPSWPALGFLPRGLVWPAVR